MFLLFLKLRARSARASSVAFAFRMARSTKPSSPPRKPQLSRALCQAQTRKVPLSNGDQLRLLVESARIRLAYTHDRQFAVSLSGIRTLPHQIEAVYLKMLPQPRLRFLLADDPGAGKTIMAGLLIKEMKLREAIDRVLILCPAPLTIQWQDEMLRWFGESFDIIFSAVDQQQLTNPWQRSNQVIASIDYAKQDDVRERVWQQRWDLVIIDEAHKCSAYTKSSSGRGDEVEKTKRYQLAEQLAAQRRPRRFCSPPRRTTATTTASPTSSGCSTPTCFPNRTGVGSQGRRNPPRHSAAWARIAPGRCAG